MAALAALASVIWAGVIGVGLGGAEAAPLWSLLDPGAATSMGGRSSGRPPDILIYAEDAPCAQPPAAVASAPEVARRRHKVRKIDHEKIVTMAPRPMPVVLHKVVHKSPHRRVHLAPAAVQRCVVLHTASLTTPELAFAAAPDLPAPIAAPDATPDFGLAGGAPADSGFACGCGGGDEGGGEAFPNPASGGGGPSGSRPPVKTPPGPISAAPEPRTWILIILGLGLCGAALRRVGRSARAQV
jgi:hypothetical protein